MALKGPSVIPEYIYRQPRRTKILVALSPLVFFVFVSLLLPYGAYFSFGIQRFVGIFGGQSQAPMESQQDESSGAFVPPEDCVEVGTWRTLSPSANRYQDHASSLPYAVETAFTLPLSSELLYFLNHGSNMAGSIDINDDGQRGSDAVTVDVQMYYNDSAVLQSSKACRLRAGPKNGAGFFTPLVAPSEHRVFFAVKLRLPPGMESSRIDVNSLQTELPNFQHDVGDLARSFVFGSVAFKASNEAINVKSIISKQTELRSTNGLIAGTFKTNNMEIVTSNGLIDTDVQLLNSGRSTDGALSMRSNNGRITSRVSLLSESQGNTGGTFKVTAKSSNGHMDISFPSAPLDSVLTVDAQTSNAPAVVRLPRTFEGTFRLQTSHSQPSVQYTQSVDDPTGTGKTRSVVAEHGRGGVVTGNVAWEPRERQRTLGSVHVKSSNGGVSLVLP